MSGALTLLMKALLEYGAFGILTMAGWGLAGYFLYRDLKKKEEISVVVNAKDIELKELNKARVADLKETNEAYNETINSVNHTLDKLTVALHVRNTGE